MVGFNYRLVVAELLGTKSFTNVKHYGHKLRLKCNLGPAHLA